MMNDDGLQLLRHRVLVPEGCTAGMLIDIEVSGGRYLQLRIPEGCTEGMMLEVEEQIEAVQDEPELSLDEEPELQRLQPRYIDIVVPEDTLPGDEIIVEDPATGYSYAVCVPKGCASGSSLNIQLPFEPAHEPPQEAANACVGIGSQYSLFCIGMAVEVYRSNGSWTRGCIDASDEASGTCTVRMEDGRIKFMVEQEDLRHYRAGAFLTGAAVAVQRRGTIVRGIILEYDDASESYLVQCVDGERLHFVTDSEIVT